MPRSRTPTAKQDPSANAITHGCTSNKLLLPGEDEQEFEHLQQAWLDDYLPDTAAFRSLLLETAEAEWLLRRNSRRYNEAEQSAVETHGAALFWPEETHKQLERFTRYRTTAERRFHRFQHAVEVYRKNRVSESLARERLRLALQKEARQQDVHEDWLFDMRTQRKQELAEEAERKEQEALRRRMEEQRRLTPIPCLTQWVNVHTVDDVFVTDLHPSNEVLLEKSKTMDAPPEKVFRNLNFTEWPDRQGYEWVEAVLPGLSNCRFQEMTFRQWLRTIEFEKNLPDGKIGPAQPEEDDPPPEMTPPDEGATVQDGGATVMERA